jgi:acyl-CoA synthetase (AMP-forming)/AMP-acid ligase II
VNAPTVIAPARLLAGASDWRSRWRADPSVELWDVLDETRPDYRLTVWNGNTFDELGWDDWRSAAHRAAGALGRAGVERGELIPCVLTNSFPTCAGAIGIWLAGAAIVSLPTPARGMAPELYLDQIRSICRALEARRMLVEERFAPMLAGVEIPGVETATFESLLDGPALATPDPPRGEEVAFVQYSSGSTSNPRGCLLTTRAIENQLDMLTEGLELDRERDMGVMWLPLSHDMGFFAFVMQTYATGTKLLMSTPERFLRAPGTWLGDCARVGGTVTGVPNFALELATRAARRSPPDRVPMRSCVVAGERVEAATIDRVTDVLAEHGLPSAALTPAYGMAEAVLAVSFASNAQEPAVATLDAAALREGEVRRVAEGGDASVQIVSAGRPLRHVEVRILGEHDTGEICVRSPSLATGYFGDRSTTDERFVDGELRTRDLGFVLDGELYVLGRQDDMLSVAGRNVWARDVEAAIGRIDGIRSGSCVLVDVHDETGARLVLVAEPNGPRDFDDLSRRCMDAAVEASGVSVHECVMVRPGTLPKTPSGKIQRFRCREQAIAGGLQVLARMEA